MKKWIILVSLLIAGCRTPSEPELGNRDIKVPRYWHPIVGGIYDFEPRTAYEGYFEMYRHGYWDCIGRYAQDINYMPKKSDSDNASGWLYEVQGYSDGYKAAEKDMAHNLKRFGRAHMTQYLKQLWDSYS
jgi:hypothetical protein